MAATPHFLSLVGQVHMPPPLPNGYVRGISTLQVQNQTPSFHVPHCHPKIPSPHQIDTLFLLSCKWWHCLRLLSLLGLHPHSGSYHLSFKCIQNTTTAQRLSLKPFVNAPVTLCLDGTNAVLKGLLPFHVLLFSLLHSRFAQTFC